MKVKFNFKKAIKTFLFFFVFMFFANLLMDYASGDEITTSYLIRSAVIWGVFSILMVFFHEWIISKIPKDK